MNATRPASCAVCAFVRQGEEARHHCHRRAPSPSTEEFAVVYWPRVRPTSRCGQGAVRVEGGLGILECGRCLHWVQPGGQPIAPDQRWGRSVEWWSETGLCTHGAPTPTSDEPYLDTEWKVTHIREGCGDGEPSG